MTVRSSYDPLTGPVTSGHSPASLEVLSPLRGGIFHPSGGFARELRLSSLNER